MSAGVLVRRDGRIPRHADTSRRSPRARHWLGAQWPFVAVLLVLAASFVYLIAQPGRWGRTSGVVATAVLLAALLRAVLPNGRAGLLAVRSRWLDALTYLVLGGVILAVDIRLHA